MDSQIFQSVIEMTEQRDLDSLEYSLIATLGELCPFSSITLYKLTTADYADDIESSIRLDITEDKSNKGFSWSSQVCLDKHVTSLSECVNSKSMVTHIAHDAEHEYWFPIKINGEVVSVLALVAICDISDSIPMVSGFIKIYENYLFILNESERDKLTGLLNRKTFDSKLARLLQTQKTCQLTVGDGRRHHQQDDTAWLVIIDVDHFKSVNDIYGHVYGDEVLLHLSQIMKGFFRSSDLLFRFGGEEFVIILEPVPAAMAHHTLDTFRKKVEGYSFPLVGSLTVSIGYISITESDFPLTALDNADKALYYAKEHGRNCIYRYEDLIASGEIHGALESGSVDLF